MELYQDVSIEIGCVHVWMKLESAAVLSREDVNSLKPCEGYHEK